MDRGGGCSRIVPYRGLYQDLLNPIQNDASPILGQRDTYRLGWYPASNSSPATLVCELAARTNGWLQPVKDTAPPELSIFDTHCSAGSRAV